MLKRNLTARMEQVNIILNVYFHLPPTSKKVLTTHAKNVPYHAGTFNIALQMLNLLKNIVKPCQPNRYKYICNIYYTHFFKKRNPPFIEFPILLHLETSTRWLNWMWGPSSLGYWLGKTNVFVNSTIFPLGIKKPHSVFHWSLHYFITGK